jgi:hypothetical protein
MSLIPFAPFGVCDSLRPCSRGASPALSEAKCFTAQSAVLRACDAAKLCAQQECNNASSLQFFW